MKKLSWKPRRTGNIYCSSACGHYCTITEFNKAIKAANKLAKLMGNEWVPKVHENLGWHYKVISRDGNVSIKEYQKANSNKELHYAAFLGGEVEYGETPFKALNSVFNSLSKKRDDLTKLLDSVPSVNITDKDMD